MIVRIVNTQILAQTVTVELGFAQFFMLKTISLRTVNVFHSTSENDIWAHPLTLLHSERSKLYGVLAFLSAVGLYRICPDAGHLMCKFTSDD